MELHIRLTVKAAYGVALCGASVEWISLRAMHQPKKDERE